MGLGLVAFEEVVVESLDGHVADGFHTDAVVVHQLSQSVTVDQFDLGIRESIGSFYGVGVEVRCCDEDALVCAFAAQRLVKFRMSGAPTFEPS